VSNSSNGSVFLVLKNVSSSTCRNLRSCQHSVASVNALIMLKRFENLEKVKVGAVFGKYMTCKRGNKCLQMIIRETRKPRLCGTCVWRNNKNVGLQKFRL
jgi:hypothetical protein